MRGRATDPVARRLVKLAIRIATVAAILIPRSAAGQGTQRPPTPVATTPSVTPDTRVRTLLSWLDDAEVIEPGGALVSVSVSRWSTQYGHETDAPTVYAAVGVAPRVQLAVSGLHYSSIYTDGFTSTGRGDTYVIGKVALISPRDHPGGLAISPVVEVLSDLSLAYRGAGASRVGWGLPISVQYTATKVRVYGSTGYFSRGSVFGSAGVEAFVAARVIASSSVAYSRATETTAFSDQLGLLRHRTDVTAGAVFIVSPSIVIFGTAGRTIAGIDPSSTTAIGTAGISFRLAGRSTSP